MTAQEFDDLAIETNNSNIIKTEIGSILSDELLTSINQFAALDAIMAKATGKSVAQVLFLSVFAMGITYGRKHPAPEPKDK